MLSEFLTTNKDELTKRCKAKAAARAGRPGTSTESGAGVPALIGQLITTLQDPMMGTPGSSAPLPTSIASSAGERGAELFREGFTVDQVVHDYGDLCQALTELARDNQVPISVDDFHTFNRCLDDAMAEAVSEFGRLREQAMSKITVESLNERLGALAHELRSPLNTAVLAFSAMRGGSVALTGATGRVLDGSLERLRDVIDRSLAEVRLTAGLEVSRERIVVDELLAELRVSAGLLAKAKQVTFTVTTDKGLAIEADREMLTSAIENLLQNAFKFTRPAGRVSLEASAVGERVVFEITDQCGGLKAGNPEDLFRPSEQHTDRCCGGYGLSITRRSVQANAGTLTVRNRPGIGCVFKIELPTAEHARVHKLSA